MLLGFFAAGTHLVTVIVACRAAALSYRRATDKPDDQGSSKISREQFMHCYWLCEHLQLIGTIEFFATSMFLMFLMFKHNFYPIIFYVCSFTGMWVLYVTGFWNVSLLKRDFNSFFSFLLQRQDRLKVNSSPDGNV